MNQRYLLFLFAMIMAFPLWSQQKINVEVSSNQFTPADITINVGDTVEWTNVQGFHNVDGRTSTYPNNPESFFSGAPAGPGWTYEHVFTEAGTYDYDCTPHAGLGMVGTVTVEAPAATARLQIVHNSPSPTVDIWVNGQPFETDFAFRTATEYREVPAGVLLNVGIAPSPSMSVNDTIVNFPITLQEGETYQVIAYGVVGDMNTPFDLKIITPAREAAEGGSGVDFTVFHGSPDAPAVDVFARDVAQIVDGAPYGANTLYQNVPAADYILDVKADNTEPIVASFSAPLSGLDGGAALVMASGFLNPGMGDPAFGLFAVLPDGTILELPQVQNTAQLQIVHNSPSPTVDIWVNGQPYETDFAFRTATEYREVPAGVVLNVGIAPSPSTSVDDTIANYQLILDPDEIYQVIAYGVVGDPATPFDLQLITPARTAAEGGSGVDFTVFHGSPDAPAVDVFARDVAQIVDGAPYGANTPYQNVPAADYILDVKADNTEPIVASFSAPLSGLDGGAALVMASGFLNPGMGDPAFGLFAVLPDGTVLELPQVQNTAQLQVVHNSPSPTVDIWVNGQPYETDFAFRTATEYREVPAGVVLNVGIAPSPSTSVDDTIVNYQLILDPDEFYQVIAYGVVGDMNTPFDLQIITPARAAAEGGSGVDFTVFHGSPDAPAVDVFARGVAQIVDGAPYGANTPYQNVPAADYTLDVKADDTDPIVASYTAPLSGLDGGAATVMASGFLNPGMNQPAFGLFAVLADGTVLELPEVQNTARLQLVHNSPNPTVDIWVNGQPFETSFAYRTATEYRDVPAGVVLNVGIAPTPSSSVDDTLANFQVLLEPDQAYQVIANGILGNPDTPFELAVITPSREAAEGGDGVDFTVFHGSPDAPAVDVFARGVAQIVDGAAYGANTPYQNVPAADYILDIKADNTDPIVASFSAPLSGLNGGAATVMASGFLNPDMNQPAFGLFAILPDGTVIELPAVQNTARLQVVHNSPSPTVDIWVNGQPFETDFAFRTATEYRDVPAGALLNVGIAPSPSTSVEDTIVNFQFILDPNATYQIIAYGVVGDMNTPFDLKVITPAREAAEGGSGIDFTVFHGSPDAPNVDVFARGVAQLVTDAPYGANTPYQNVPAADYTLDVKQAGTDPVVAAFSAPLSGLDGGAATVMASGFLVPDGNEPAFGLFAVLPDGTVIELPLITNVNQAFDGEVRLYPNPVVSRAILELDVEASGSGNVEIDLINIQGQQVGRIFDGPLSSGLNRIDFNAARYSKGQYFIRVSNDNGVSVFPMIVQ